MSDWTVDSDTGRSNSSPEFERLVCEVEQLIRDGAWSLINHGPRSLARTIMAQLVHVHGLEPKKR